MGYTFTIPGSTKRPGFTVEVNTPTEAEHVIRALAAAPVHYATPGHSLPAQPAVVVYATALGAGRSSGTAFATVSRPEDLPLGLRILEAIRRAPSGVTSAQLCNLFGLETGRALGGAMIGINSKLEVAGINPAEVLEYIRFRPGTDSIWKPKARINEAIEYLAGPRLNDLRRIWPDQELSEGEAGKT